MAAKQREKINGIVSIKPYTWPSNVIGLPAFNVVMTTSRGRVLKIDKFTGGKPMQTFFKHIPHLFTELAA